MLLHLLFVLVCCDRQKLASGALRFLSEFSYYHVPEEPLLKPQAEGHGVERLLAPKMCSLHEVHPVAHWPLDDLGPGL